MNARKILQRTIKVKDDGIIGAVSLAAIRQLDTADLVQMFNAERISFYTRISTFPTFGRGWMNRMVDNLRYAVEDFA